MGRGELYSALLVIYRMYIVHILSNFVTDLLLAVLLWLLVSQSTVALIGLNCSNTCVCVCCGGGLGVEYA